MKKEQLQEGWVDFLRLHCKEGFIDRWQGDSAHDPNKEKKHPLCVNSFTSYYRLNGEGEWVHKAEFENRFFSDLLDCREDFTAEEIWSENKIER